MNPANINTVLSYMTGCRPYWHDEDFVAKELSLPPSDIRNAFIKIVNHFPHHFTYKTHGDGTWAIMMHENSSDYLQQFLQNGGFVKLQEIQEEQQREQKQLAALTKESLQVSIYQARKAISDSRFAKKMAWVSLIVSLLAIIVGAITTLKAK